MTDKKKSKKQEIKDNASEAEVELSPEEQAHKNKLITFVANNILNSITLNQAVTVVQQVALRDAHTIVEEADDVKLKEIEAALITAEEEAANGGEGDGSPESSDS